MTRKPRLFVASASESLEVAHAVKQNFEKDAIVDIWSEDIFKVNSSTLETLLNRAGYYDFFIAVFSADDTTIIRKTKAKITRGNVVFEFGLFLGRLGPHRAFFIAEEGSKVFSDWDGVTRASYSRRENLVAATGTACNLIRKKMRDAEKLQHFTMLPSTSLAIGYYDNFIKKVLESFQSVEHFTIIERDSKGVPIKETKHTIKDRYPTIHVMLPRRLSDLEPEILKQRTSSLRQIKVDTAFRQFSFYVSGKISKTKKKITLFDIPTTMLSSRAAIDHIFSKDFLASDNNRQVLEDREIANFERTLRIMVPDSIEKEFFKFSVME